VPALRVPALPRPLHPRRHRRANPPPPGVPPLRTAGNDLRGGLLRKEPVDKRSNMRYITVTFGFADVRTVVVL
jgi:hypothetical protein